MGAGFVEIAEKGEDASVGGGAVRRVVHVLHHRNQALERLERKRRVQRVRVEEWERRRAVNDLVTGVCL